MSAVRVDLARRKCVAIGLMSGTSHDGVSAAVVELDDRRRPPARVHAFITKPYSRKFRARLMEASTGTRVGAVELSALNFELGRAFASTAMAAARRAAIALSSVDFIGSHGHTFFHLPPGRARASETPSTLQLGEPAIIAAAVGAPVVSDFRSLDIALGGEGAPLAPLAHVWLFAHPTLGRVIQNIGGIANATWVPAGAQIGDHRIIAFDTGPGVMLIDALASEQTQGRLGFDRDGIIAARGRISETLLSRLMRHPYFARRPPKSTGREEFGASYLREVK
ncbi:MAG: anhydro-N-acetylmuramic acid kinase, partial [Candidatus Binataceae bacterium]